MSKLEDFAVRERTRRLVAGARRYADGDKSDPFSYSRAMTHIANGLCDPRQDGKDGGYDATEASEEAETMLGVKYQKTVYRNMARP